MSEAFDKDDLAMILTDDDKLWDIWDEAFTQADKDKSGVIDKSELGNVMKNVSKMLDIPTPTPDFINDVYEQLDKNQDGKISAEEFAVYTRNLLQEIYDTLE